MKKSIYLDYAAATPIDSKVLQKMLPFFSEDFFNPTANYSKSKLVKEKVTEARKQVAMILGSRSNEIIFTTGGTESNNIAIKGVMDLFKDANILYSSIEHEAVINPAKSYNHKEIKVDEKGNLDFEDLKKKIDSKTVLISVMHVNNEIGVINKLSLVAEIIKKERLSREKNNNPLPLYLHSDASQSPNLLSLVVDKLGIDLMTLNGGKIYGPKQSGALYIRNGTKLKPLIEGGGQEDGIRSGTLNPANIIGFSESLKLANEIRKDEEKRLQKITGDLIKKLLNNPKITLNGPVKNRAMNNINICIDGVDNETIIYKLDQKGIMVASGSACSASDQEPSHVLKAIGLSDKQARESIRISIGRTTSDEDLEYFYNALMELI